MPFCLKGCEKCNEIVKETVGSAIYEIKNDGNRGGAVYVTSVPNEFVSPGHTDPRHITAELLSAFHRRIHNCLTDQGAQVYFERVRGCQFEMMAVKK